MNNGRYLLPRGFRNSRNPPSFFVIFPSFCIPPFLHYISSFSLVFLHYFSFFLVFFHNISLFFPVSSLFSHIILTFSFYLSFSYYPLFFLFFPIFPIFLSFSYFFFLFPIFLYFSKKKKSFVKKISKFVFPKINE